MALINFTPSTTRTDFQPLPNGEYETIITKTDVTMRNGVSDLFIEYTVTAGEHANRRIFEHIRFETEIGKNILSVILECCNMKSLADSDELCGQRIAVKVSNDPGRDGKTWTNVRGHRAIASAPAEHRYSPADSVPF